MPEVTSNNVFSSYETWRSRLLLTIDRIVPLLADTQEPTAQLLDDLMFLKDTRKRLTPDDDDAEDNEDNHVRTEVHMVKLRDGESPEDAMERFVQERRDDQTVKSFVRKFGTVGFTPGVVEHGIGKLIRDARKSGTPITELLRVRSEEYHNRMIAAGLDPEALRVQLTAAMLAKNEPEATRIREEIQAVIAAHEKGAKK